MDRKKILVVDDEQDTLNAIKVKLENEGFEVLTASDGYQALGAVWAQEPDLIILDVLLPLENGYRVSKLIKEGVKTGKISKKILIILLTARRLDGDPERTPDREEVFMDFSHADLMIYKPFDMLELIDQVHGLLIK